VHVDPRLLRRAGAARGYLAVTVECGLAGAGLILAQEGKLTAATESHRLDDINQVLERLEHGLVEGRAVVVP
jgi:hypothetical protein